ncbi:MAG TPA: LCP family protein [Candidatus Acidoferrum sp.]|nr:LCP family protein [Candidatus Acidoferrum sp.]
MHHHETVVPTPPTPLRHAVPSRLSIVVLAAVIAVVGVVATPPARPDPAGSSTGDGSTTFAQVLAATTPDYTSDMSKRILGTDGRFTILLLGSDSRPSHPGIRTDTIMIVSVDPKTGKAAAVSIPRDTVNFPLSSTRRFGGKINAMYAYLARSSRTPGTSMRMIVGRALGIEIDAYALVGFDAFRKLVNNVGGVRVYVAKTFYDPTYSIKKGHRGWGLKKGWHTLRDLQALAFARTRHADSDYARARRQQQLVVAAVSTVKSHGLDGLVALIAASRGLIRTDIPLEDAPLIYTMVSRANLATANRTVFGPAAFATSIGGFNNVLKLAVARAWIRTYFPTVHKNGIWLPPVVPPPSPSPTPSASPSPSPSDSPSDPPSPSPSASTGG